jgi:ArsR family transcriptional regulator
MRLLYYFKGLAEETRLRLYYVLLHYELNVNEIVTVMAMGQSRISRHLKILAESGLIASRREGSFVYYAAAENGATGLLAELVRHGARDESGFAGDLDRAEEILHERRQATRRFFNSVAPHWDRLKREVLGDFDLAGIIRSRLPADSTVADLGCGTGELLLVLQDIAHRIVGVDSSPNMLGRARERLSQAQSKVDLRLGELEHLPVGDGEVDAAVVNMVLHHISLPAAGIKEAHRILRPGGTLIIADFEKHDREDIRARFGGAWLGFDRGELLQWLENVGFRPVETRSYQVRNNLQVNVFVAVKG